jgi:hypothetical protein
MVQLTAFTTDSVVAALVPLVLIGVGVKEVW